MGRISRLKSTRGAATSPARAARHPHGMSAAASKYRKRWMESCDIGASGRGELGAGASPVTGPLDYTSPAKRPASKMELVAPIGSICSPGVHECGYCDRQFRGEIVRRG